MTTSYSTSSPVINKYKTQGDYSPAACHPFLENFDTELFENDPELHTFVHDNFVTHGSSGKRAIGDVGDIDAIEHPVAPPSPQGLATPLRRRLATPGQAPGTLSKSQELVYHLAPAIVHKVDKELAAIILKCFSSTYAKSELRKHCGSSGRAMLLHLEKRGKCDAGDTLFLIVTKKLDRRQEAGVGPVSLANWTKYSTEMASIAAQLGGMDDKHMIQRLKAGVYKFPREHRGHALAAGRRATTPGDFTAAVDAYLLEEQLADELAQGAVPQGIDAHGRVLDMNGAPVLAVDNFNSEPQPVLYSQPHPGRQFSRDQRRDPPLNVAMPPLSDRRPPHSNTAYLWSAAEHPPCRNWVQGKDGCNGRHHLPQCPIPRPVGAVFTNDTETDLDTPPPPTLVATAACHTVPEPAPPATIDMTHVAPAARDFSALFGNGSIQAVLHVARADENAADILTKPTLVAEAPASAMAARTPHTEPRRLASLAETRRRLEVSLPFPPMPVYE